MTFTLEKFTFFLHLIAYAFQIPVKRNEKSDERNKEIAVYTDREKRDVLIPYTEINIEVNHRDYVSPFNEALLKQFYVNTISQDGSYQYVQYMKHKTKPIYCVQFHPETRSDYDFQEAKQTGVDILRNFFQITKENKNNG